MAYVIDESLREFALNDEQWEKYVLRCKYGSNVQAAKHSRYSRSAIQRAVAAIEKNAARHGVHAEIHRPAPPGFVVKGTSTLYDLQTGDAKIQWVKTDADKEAQAEAMREAVQGLCENIKPTKAIRSPKDTAPQLMSVYPIGDHHIGMLSWIEETDGDYTTKEAERLLMSAMDYLVDAAPKSDQGLIILLGDFLHYDSYESVTPQSKHQLDADSRFPRLVRAAMRAVRYAIAKALEKHKQVRVIVVSGNHDPSSMVFLREALYALYEKETRIEIDRSPKLFHYHRFGDCLIGTHHGDKVKMQNLPLVMASDAPEDWGKSRHRIIFTGHVHHDSRKDFNGCTVESVRILAPADAYAYGLGYRTPRDMKRIDFHATYGEVSRQTVTPEMCEE